MDRVFFQKSYWRIHKMIDSAYFVVGRWHRKYYHNNVNALSIANNMYPGDPVALEAAVLHLWLDIWCSSNPHIKKMLEDAAKKYYKEMKRSKKKDKFNKKIKLTLELEKLVHDLKKALEARRWHDRFYGIR
jgi:hypothetical protein